MRPAWRALGGVAGTLLAAVAVAVPAFSGAPPVPSTVAPHPTAPVVTFAGMTLEIRSGRVVVTGVARGSPAEGAGVLPLDVLLVVNDRSLVDLDPIAPQQLLGLLKSETTLRTRLVIGRGAGTLSVDLPGKTAPAEVTPTSELRLGDPAPEFSGRDLQGKTLSLKDLRGSLVLIDFWSSACPPCERAAIPLRRLAEQYQDKVRIVGISLDDDRKSFEAFVYNHHLPGSQLFDGAGWQGAIARLYGAPSFAIPRYVLVGPDGRIAAIGTFDEIEAAIARMTRGTSS